MNLSDRLQQLVDEKAITKYRLAKDIGVRPAVVGRWLSGENMPSLEKAADIADYFDVSVDYMLGRSDNPKVDNGHEIITTTDEKTNLIDASPEEMAAIRAFLRAYREEKER